MPQEPVSPPDLALVLGPDDTAIPMGAAPPRRGRRPLGRDMVPRHDTIYVVVHRSRGLWTHVYRLSRSHQPDHLWVFLEKVYEGDRAAEACAWARSLSVEASAAE